MNFKIKKQWTTKTGLKAVIIIANPTYPHYCGYVGVDDKHHAFQRQYYESIDDNKDKYKQAYLDVQEKINSLQAHGGLTFGDKAYWTDKSNLYWFGFDVAHAGDAVDWKAGEEITITNEEKRQVKEVKEIINKYPVETDTVKSLDYVIEQCESLAQQLKDLDENM